MAAVPTVAPPGVFSGTANVIAVGVLLLEFGMFRQALLRDQVRLESAQAWPTNSSIPSSRAQYRACRRSWASFQ